MSDLVFHPATPDRWSDVEKLFGERGACGGCWCMWFRLTNKQFEAGKGDGNRRALRRIVSGGGVPGILAYVAGEPVGWCSVAPRDEFSRLQRSRILKPVDDRPVWSIVCLFVAREHRGRGVSTALIRAAADHAAGRGATIVEGYAVEPRKERMPEIYAYHGLRSAYVAAGFEEVERRSPTRPIMRYLVPA
jgi:GNAT superfamily N-acetyltransferase